MLSNFGQEFYVSPRPAEDSSLSQGEWSINELVLAPLQGAAVQDAEVTLKGSALSAVGYKSRCGASWRRFLCRARGSQYRWRAH